MFDLKVEMSAEPVVEGGLFNVTGGLKLQEKVQESADQIIHNRNICGPAGGPQLPAWLTSPGVSHSQCPWADDSSG